MWTDIVVFFLVAAILLYVVFGGADFGAGILELFLQRRRKQTVRILSHALAPVWEANHVWLIVVVVVLFTAFPKVFALLSTYLHIPLLIMLVGIIFRGAAFTFRHYDAIQDDTHVLYTRFFTVSSLLTPFALGLVFSGATSGRLTATPSTFFDGYVAPWWGLDAVALGVFFIALFSYFAAVFAVGETQDPVQRRYFRKAVHVSGVAAVASGGVVLLLLKGQHPEYFMSFFTEAGILFFPVTATLLFGVVFRTLAKDRVHVARLAVGAQGALIVLGWFWPQLPALVMTAQGPLTVQAMAAPEATMRTTAIALLLGSAVIFPGLFYLFRTFKFPRKN